jgi:hypothetical protein
MKMRLTEALLQRDFDVAAALRAADEKLNKKVLECGGWTPL